MGRRGLVVVLLSGLLFLIPEWNSTSAAQEGDGSASFKVVVHEDNPLDELPRETLTRMFLYQVRRWDFGDPKVENLPTDVVEHPEGATIRDDFAWKVHRRPPDNVKRFWMRVIFSGRGRQPPTRSNDKEILEYIRERPGAVGYVAVDTPLLPGTKELRILDLKKK